MRKLFYYVLFSALLSLIFLLGVTKLPLKTEYHDSTSQGSILSLLNKKNIKDPTTEYAPYNGIVENIFFHPVLGYPKRALTDSGKLDEVFDDYFVTAIEYKKILQQLYDQNYVCIDFDTIYDKKIKEGNLTFTRKPLMLPKNKKPFFMSIDDLNYYAYMVAGGTASKLVLDSNGNPAGSGNAEDGKMEIRYDTDIIPITEAFIKEHPDFSIGKARGIIALTGFNGIMGYRTDNLEGSDYLREKNEVLAVVKRLKELGWKFASHSYTHGHMPQVSTDRVKYDTDKWEREVEPLIGKTNLFIYPFGDVLDDEAPSLQYLLNHGFDTFFGVSNSSVYESHQRYMLIERIHIDGMLFKVVNQKTFDLFELDKVVDFAIRK